MERSSILQEPDIPALKAGEAWPHRPSHWRPCHHHGELELNLVTSGSAQMRLGGRKVKVTRGDLVWLVPGESHELISAARGFDMWVVAFSQKLRQCVEQRWTSRRAPYVHRRVVQLDAHVTERLAQRFHAASQSDHVEDVLGASLEAAFRETRVAECRLTSHVSVSRALVELQGEFNSSRDELARAVGVTPQHLSRLFAREVGVGVPEYRNRLKLARYLKLEEENERVSILSSALAAGFGSYPQFHRAFVRQFGCPPRDFERAETRNSVRTASGPGR